VVEVAVRTDRVRRAALFVREKGRAKLTALGLRLLPQLTQAFDSIEAAFAQHREEDEALLTVATTFTFANTWLAWRLGSFQVEHPDLAVRLATSNKLVDLKAGDADVAIRAGARFALPPDSPSQYGLEVRMTMSRMHAAGDFAGSLRSKAAVVRSGPERPKPDTNGGDPQTRLPS